MDAFTLRERIIGTWSLVSYELVTAAGDTLLPFGENPVGFLHYGAEGFMAVHVMRRDRRVTGLSLDDLSEDLASQVLAEHFSYYGRFRTETDTVVHSVTVAAMPDWVGTEQRRHAAFEDGRMVFSAEDVRFEKQGGRAVLVWQPC